MSRTEQMNWETVNVTGIEPGIEVVLKGELVEEIVLPAIAILHQTLFGEDSVTERIVLGVLDMGTGEIFAAEPEQVVTVLLDDGDDTGDGEAGVEPLFLGDSNDE
jgi:hypothetical protein